jgi:DNA-binding response OmpR family regulator
MKILLLEPDKVLADTYRNALRSAGHKVVMCASAQAAIFAADDLQPDVVITELQLTGHSGIEFLYEFRSYEDWSETPVIAMTNVPAGEFKGSWELLRDQLGVRAYHYKPMTSLRTLLRTVEAVVPAKA